MSDNYSTSHAQRIAMIERKQAGGTLSAIAVEMQLNPYTVRKWWRKYRQEGWAGILPKKAGRPATGALSSFEPLLRYVALRLKRQHPAWGLDKLILELSRRPSLRAKTLPKRTALYSYLRQFYPRLSPHRRLPTKSPSQSSLQRAQAAHHCWQIDFKGQVKLGAVGTVKPFVVCDEYSAAPLATIVHLFNRNHLNSRHVQSNLRQVFSQYGLPNSIRMDRDPLWIGGSRLEWPGVLLLWLVGLGIQPIINRPYRPTDNAQVERNNRTWNEHIAIGSQYPSLTAVQHATEQDIRDRLYQLPSRNRHCQGQAPFLAIPQLAQAPRSYQPEQENNLFEMQRVYDYLATWTWQRKVSINGSISMANINCYIHSHYARQVVKVHFEASSQQFVASDLDDHFLNAFSLAIISPDYILNSGGT